jgi:hypothetical protein
MASKRKREKETVWHGAKTPRWLHYCHTENVLFYREKKIFLVARTIFFQHPNYSKCVALQRLRIPPPAMFGFIPATEPNNVVHHATQYYEFVTYERTLMAGPNSTLKSPWPPLTIRPCHGLKFIISLVPDCQGTKYGSRENIL